MIGATRIVRPFRKPLLDIRLGLALLRDRRVPFRSKLLALFLGLVLTGVMEFLELPIESILATLLPIFGAAGDFVLDGAQLVAGPLLLACVFLPFVAPRVIVGQIRSERSTRARTSSTIDI